ncbi:MAG: hypothetical protein FWG71_09605 [Synergistaceae bacterium]|nr:hypothetical protein [Synergistaceae bacterium]
METMTAEQAAEAAKGLTFEIVWAALMETRQRMEESHQRMEESHQRMEESRREMEKDIMETRREMEKDIMETRRRMEESHQRTEKNIADLSKNIGGLGNSFGLFTETMFSTEIMKKFDELGFQFDTQTKQKKFRQAGRLIAEIDSVLENGEYVMLVEIKANLSVEDVEEHLERIAIIREYMDARGDSRKLVGAVAGGVVPESVLNYAQKKGLYVLVQTGDAVAIAAMPSGLKAREW